MYILPSSSDNKVRLGPRLILPLHYPTYTRVLIPINYPTDSYCTCPSCSSPKSAPASPTCASYTHLPCTPSGIPIPSLNSRCPDPRHDLCSPSNPNTPRSPSCPNAAELPCSHQGKEMEVQGRIVNCHFYNTQADYHYIFLTSYV